MIIQIRRPSYYTSITKKVCLILVFDWEVRKYKFLLLDHHRQYRFVMTLI